MLEWIATPYGEMVPKVNGNLLASKVDPTREARQWVLHHEAQIKSAPAHVLLGVGGGHHLYEAALSFPEIEFFGIEYLEGLNTSPLYSQIRALMNVELIMATTEKKIYKSERLQKTVGDVFTILVHQNSARIMPEFYERLAESLVGRDWRSFNQILNFRAPEEMFLNEMNFHPKANTLLGVNEIYEFISKKEEEYSDAEMIWLTLGELVR